MGQHVHKMPELRWAFQCHKNGGNIWNNFKNIPRGKIPSALELLYNSKGTKILDLISLQREKL